MGGQSLPEYQFQHCFFLSIVGILELCILLRRERCGVRVCSIFLSDVFSLDSLALWPGSILISIHYNRLYINFRFPL